MGNKLVRARQYPWGVVQGECGASLSPAGASAQSHHVLPAEALTTVLLPSAHLHGCLTLWSSLRHVATLLLFCCLFPCLFHAVEP